MSVLLDPSSVEEVASHPKRRRAWGIRGVVVVAALLTASLFAACDACTPVGGGLTAGVDPADPTTHPWFPIDAAAVHAVGRATDDVAAISCETCHTNPSTFVEFSCTTCHEHEPTATNLLHATTTDYAYENRSCLGCHAAGVQEPPFDHVPGRNSCATCHAEGAAFHELPVAGHPEFGTADCSSCHLSTTDWHNVSRGEDRADPRRNVEVLALSPVWQGTRIDHVVEQPQSLAMPMVHASPEVDPALACTACHRTAGSFYPGTLHDSLEIAGLAQPTTCESCHAASAPAGFVGPRDATSGAPLVVDPPRVPATGEMRHDAVAWANDVATTTPLVGAECVTCHVAPSAAQPATWAGTGTIRPGFHLPLSFAGLPQPSSCIDCHANSRPDRVMTAADSSVPDGVRFDHSVAETSTDCVSCHAASVGAPLAERQQWTGGRYHRIDAAAPTSCSGCHEGERPTSTATWLQPDFEQRPFDYAGNAQLQTNHGDGRDCIECHAGPGTGTWGVDQNWQGGEFIHPPASTPADALSCARCHTSQRPDLVLPTSAALIGFDHATSGRGDCTGCHQATVVAGIYENYFNAQGTLPGGDWKDGVAYPGAFPIGSLDSVVRVDEIALTRNAGLITGFVATSETLFNTMVHTAAVLPAALNAGLGADETKCWHCHQHDAGGVMTSPLNGAYHASLTTFSATPGGTVVPFAQPTTGCTQCHVAPLAARIQRGNGSNLLPMDHGVVFTAAVVIDGQSAASVRAMDCASCHTDPGGSWAGASFHAHIANASIADCAQCHYPTMADRTLADVAQGTTFQMKHQSTQLREQNCQTCHTTSFARAATTPPSAALWGDGDLHGHVAVQPTQCNECHSVSAPSTLTQAEETYVLDEGRSVTNEGQWMSHRFAPVQTQDCARCHVADAQAAQLRWNRATPLHTNVTTTTCVECHGVGAPGGATNNLPVGTIATATVSGASPTSGVPAGTLDRITHADANVASRDCIACHTQVGPSSSAPVSGKEWAQASYHRALGATVASNPTSARCSSCHLNVKPPAGYVVDHTAYTDAAGTTDCVQCHLLPGTGSFAAPTWLGAVGGAPTTMAVGGFIIPQPPASAPGTIEPSIPNLPHPSGAAATNCASCHAGGLAGRNAFAYDHAAAGISGRCGACHEAGSDLVTALWNGASTLDTGAGDTRPFTIGAMAVQTAAYPGRTLDVVASDHFYPTDCNECHAVAAGPIVASTSGAAYRAAWAFPHDQTKMASPSTCVQCHGGNLAPVDLVDDPARNVIVDVGLPTFAATSIVSVTASTQTLPMSMDHGATSIPPAAMSSCANCHLETTTYYPGDFHSSLANLSLANPGLCVECHTTAQPDGFVGPIATAPPRTPSSAEMRHDAVAWAADAPTSTRLVTADCVVCHSAPSQAVSATWRSGAGGAAAASFHESLERAAAAQPSSCIDCHANSRATSNLTAGNAALPAGIQFDHTSADAMNDCVSCHDAGGYTSWTGGRFHRVGDANPSTCLPCHDAQRPVAPATATSPAFAIAPFDFVTNVDGVTHGAGMDCVECHKTSGTGTWGVDQDWRGGSFNHVASPLPSSTCILCHTTQRPDRVVNNAAALLGFDHAINGRGDCIGCHQATRANNRFGRLFNAQGTFPGGDWRDAGEYPGEVLVSDPGASVSLTQTRLVRSGTRNFVTSTTSVTAILQNAMLHTSSALPASLQAGPTSAPDATTCWHCHTNTNGVVTSFSNGNYHASLTAFRANPGGPIAALPQPTACLDCHAQMRPSDIVTTRGITLRPMDHNATFTTTVTLGGRVVGGVAAMECAQCHADPGGTWADGTFHDNIGAAVPADCVRCHYPLMATPASSDLTSASTYTMKHASVQLTTQDCAACHTTALARATQVPATTLWSGATLHPHASPQPTSCIECHTVSNPTATTQGTVAWTFTSTTAATATNAGQWMRHNQAYTTSRDCAACHAADARTSGSAWNKAAPFHPVVTTATTCAVCHGLTNGNGAVVGTRNNMPLGLTNSATTSSVAGLVPGVPAGTKDQLVHSDVNVTGHDCNFCHTQAGASTTAGVAGREWLQASFHTRFTTANPLLMNTTTGRCSACHLNVKPGTGYSVDHTSFTSASGSTDCSSCHSWPGTGTSAAPNWKGAAGGFPTFITVGGFTIPTPPAAAAGTTQIGIANLPHPTTATACTSCHTGGVGGKNAIGYDHASTLANGKCSACHEAGSNLVSPTWNNATALAAGLGDTRPFTLTSLRVTYKGNSLTVTGGNHFFPVDCYQCHVAPTGVAKGATTNAALQTAWRFPHTERNMTNPGTCRLCHGNNIPN